jgi:tape measure domain-containing protein
MAGNNQKEVDLVIRAKDLSSKTLKDTAAAVDEVTSALSEQAKVAQKTDASVEELKKGISDLTKSESDLARQQTALDKAVSSTAASMDRAAARQSALSEQLVRLNQQLDEQIRKAEGAAGAFELFSNDILSVGPPTKQAVEQLQRFQTQTEKIEAGVGALQGEIAQVQASMYGAAAATAELATIQDKLVVAQQQVTTAIKNTSAAADANKAKIAAIGEAERAAAEAIKQADRDAAQAKRESAAAAAQAARQEAEAAKQRAAEEVAARKAEEAAVKKNKQALDSLTSGQRESLSWYQRLRGEVLALASTYAGLQGAINIAKEALDSFQNRQTSTNILSVIADSTDSKKIGEEFEYVRGVADRLGFNVQKLTKDYGQFAVAAKASGATTQETRFIFEKLAETVRSLGLNDESTKGMFLAITQMFSKGKIEAQELRQQLGEHLPGAAALLAKSLGVPTSALDKMLQKGQIGADKILNFVDTFSKEFGKNLPNTLDGMNAELGRTGTAFNDFKLIIADSGFAAGFTKFLRVLQDFFKSAEGKKFAQELSDGFTKVLDVLTVVVNNFQLVRDVMTLILTIKIGQFLIGIAGSAVAAATNILTLNAALAGTSTAGVAAAGGLDAAATSATGLTKALGAIQKVLLTVTAFMTGWEIGTILRNKFEIVQLAAVNMVQNLMEVWINLRYGLIIVLASLSESIVDIANKAVKGIDDIKNGFLGNLVELAKKFGLDKLGELIASGISTNVKTGLDVAAENAKKTVASARAMRDKEIADSRSVAQQMMVDIVGANGARLASPKPGAQSGPTDKPDKSGVTPPAADDSKAEKLRERLEQSLADKLNNINKKVEKDYKDSLDARLEATRRSFKDIEDTIVKAQKAGVTSVDGTPLAQFKAQVAALKEQAVQQETIAFNTEALKKGEQAVNDLMKERKDLIAEVTADQAAGLIDNVTAYEKIKKINEELVPVINLAADGMAKFAANLKSTPGISDNKLDALVAKMQKISSAGDVFGPKSGSAEAGMTLFNQTLAETNNILQQRNAEVATYNQMVDLGVMTHTDAQAKIKTAFDATQPSIDKAVASMKELLAVMAQDGNIPQEKLNALNAQLVLLQTNAKYADKELTAVKDAFESSFSKGFEDVVNGMADAFAGLIRGTMSWGDALKSVGSIALKALGSIAQAVAETITKMIALRIVSSIFGAFGGDATAGASTTGWTFTPTVSHAGGVVGDVASRSRSISAMAFAGAPRYHTGTVVGLSSDEQAAILQKGEEVLSKDNPRNIMNQTKAGVAKIGAQGPQTIRNILVTDPNMIPDAMQSARGEQTLVSVIGKNRGKVRKILGF